MTTPGNIEVVVPADSDYTLESWDVRTQAVSNGAIQITNATAVIQVSLDNINWQASGCQSPKKLNSTSGTHIWELRGFSTRYMRVVYSHGGNTAGTIKIMTYKHPEMGPR